MAARSPGARWRGISFLALAGLTALYSWYESRSFTHGGSPAGIAFGVLALLLILLLLLFGVRKRWYTSRWGTLEGWLQAHIWLGLLTLVVVLYHAGFRFQDKIATAALVALVLVIATGIAGAILYSTLPRRLTEVEGNLAPAEISDQLNRLARAMARLARGRSEAFQGVYRGLLAESLPASFAGWRLLFGAGRLDGNPGRLNPGKRAGGNLEDSWAVQLRRVGAGEQEALRELLVLSRQHKELHLRLRYRQRYKNLLEVWLYAHVPLSVALAVLVVAHLVAAFYYRGL